MSITCGKAVGNLWIESGLLKNGYPSNGFRIFPQLFPDLSTVNQQFSTANNRNLSTFPQDLLLQLYILTNPYYLDGESRGPKK